MRPRHRVVGVGAAVVPLLSALVFASCAPGSVAQPQVEPEADSGARSYLALLSRQQVDSALALLPPSARKPDDRSAIAEVSHIVAGTGFDSLHLISAEQNDLHGVRRTSLSYEFLAPAGWHAASVALVDSAGSWNVEGVSIQPLPDKLETMHAFANVPVRPSGVLWFACMLIFAGLSHGTALFLATRRAMPRRFAWAIVSLIGIGAFRLNWSNGSIEIAPLQVVVGSAAFLHPNAARPWFFVFGLPIGALLVLWRYRHWRRTTAAAHVAPMPVSAPRDA